MSDRVLVTDPADPGCPRCHGQGTVGGCARCGVAPVKGHMHTYSFCECVNERFEERTDDE